MSDLQKETAASEVETNDNQAADNAVMNHPAFGIYAMVNSATNIVHDKLECLNTFKMEGHYFVEVGQKIECEKGMIYDVEKKTFILPPVEVEEETTSEDSATVAESVEQPEQIMPA